MSNSRIFRAQVEFADSFKPKIRRRQIVDDPIPDPEPAAPSLGYPDPGIFQHPPIVCANAVLIIRAERQPPIGPMP